MNLALMSWPPFFGTQWWMWNVVYWWLDSSETVLLAWVHFRMFSMHSFPLRGSGIHVIMWFLTLQLHILSSGSYNKMGRQMTSCGPPRCSISWKCLLNLLVQEQPLLPVLDVFSVGWVRIRPSQGAAAEMLLKMTHNPAHFSWTQTGSLQTIK